MSAAELPKGPTAQQQLDLLQRLKVRDRAFDEMLMPLLTDEERERVDVVLSTYLKEGITDAVARQARFLLVDLGARDQTDQFLTDEERRALVALVDTENRKPKKNKRLPTGMSTGEVLTTVGVVVSVALAAILTYVSPTLTTFTIWVCVWGVLCGGSFIADVRHRSRKAKLGAISAGEGILAMTVWLVAGIAVALLSGHPASPGTVALLCFIGAGFVGRALLKIEDEDGKS